MKNDFAHGRFHEVGQKQKTERKERETLVKGAPWAWAEMLTLAIVSSLSRGQTFRLNGVAEWLELLVPPQGFESH